jgi:hypothetical protein
MHSTRKAVLQGWNLSVVVQHLRCLAEARMGRRVFIQHVLQPMEAMPKRIVTRPNSRH